MLRQGQGRHRGEGFPSPPEARRREEKCSPLRANLISEPCVKRATTPGTDDEVAAPTDHVWRSLARRPVAGHAHQRDRAIALAERRQGRRGRPPAQIDESIGIDRVDVGRRRARPPRHGGQRRRNRAARQRDLLISVPDFSDRFDLDKTARYRETRDDGRSGRPMIAERLGISSVEGREIFDSRQKDGRLDDIAQCESIGPEYLMDVAEGAARLRPDVAPYLALVVEGELARKIEMISASEGGGQMRH